MDLFLAAAHSHGGKPWWLFTLVLSAFLFLVYSACMTWRSRATQNKAVMGQEKALKDQEKAIELTEKAMELQEKATKDQEELIRLTREILATLKANAPVQPASPAATNPNTEADQENP